MKIKPPVIDMATVNNVLYHVKRKALKAAVDSREGVAILKFLIDLKLELSPEEATILVKSCISGAAPFKVH